MSATNKVAIFFIGILFIWSCICICIRMHNIDEEDGTFQETAATQGRHRRHIFILAGQSNMAGRGGVDHDNRTWDGFVPQESDPNPGILRLSAGLSWEEAREPLHSDIDSNKTCGIGPGLAFANGVLRKDDEDGDGDLKFKAVGLVPCAVGGSSIKEWGRGSLLYNNLIARANVALKDGGIVEGILWYQGERDTIVREDADAYKAKFEQLILDLRNDLPSPHLPVIEVVLASAEGPWMDVVREAQLGIELPNVIKVDARGLGLNPDGLHLSTESQVRLGQMMADAYLTFKPNMGPIKNSRAQ